MRKCEGGSVSSAAVEPGAAEETQVWGGQRGPSPAGRSGDKQRVPALGVTFLQV